MENGVAPPKSKLTALLPRLCIAIHTLDSIVSKLLRQVPAVQVEEEISLETLERALYYVQHMEAQKQIIFEVKFMVYAFNFLPSLMHWWGSSIAHLGGYKSFSTKGKAFKLIQDKDTPFGYDDTKFQTSTLNLWKFMGSLVHSDNRHILKKSMLCSRTPQPVCRCPEKGGKRTYEFTPIRSFDRSSGAFRKNHSLEFSEILYELHFIRGIVFLDFWKISDCVPRGSKRVKKS